MHVVCKWNKVKSVVSDWLRHQSKGFYAEEKRKLVHRWDNIMYYVAGKLC